MTGSAGMHGTKRIIREEAGTGITAATSAVPTHTAGLVIFDRLSAATATATVADLAGNPATP